MSQHESYPAVPPESPRHPSLSDHPCGSQRKRHLRPVHAGSEALRALASGSVVASTSDSFYRGLDESRHVTIQLAPTGTIVCLLYARSVRKEVVTLVYQGNSIPDAVESANAMIQTLRKDGFTGNRSRQIWFSERDVVTFLRSTAESRSPFSRAATTCLRREDHGLSTLG